MDEEIDSAMETNECLVTENEGHPENKDAHKTEPEETENVFVKPALFAAPSLTSKRSSVAAAETKPAVENNQAEAVDTTRNGSADVNKTTNSDQGDQSNGAKRQTDQHAAPDRTKPEAKHRALPKGLPAANPPPIKYTEPPWGGKAPDSAYALEILKNGTILDKVPLVQRSYFVVGRLPVCDVSLEHPSISRYHAVIQYRSRAGEGEPVGEESGFYVHDLGSTHGTVVNKNKIPPKTYVRLRVGHVLKFGGSTRLFILQGPEYDEEQESELTVTELREQARKQRAELERRMMGDGSDEDDEKEGEGMDEENDKNPSKLSNEDSGCSWGMAEEAVPEDDENEENPFSTEFQEDQEAAYLKDPKKALQGFYDREGEELEFEYEDKSRGSWLCRIKLPVDDAMGRQLVAEVTHTGKKKEAAIQCCLEACRMLEARGLLRQEAVSRKRKKKNWEDEDYYDSDDDTFLDRTGTVEKKRQERMKKAGKIEEQPETYESLVAKLSEVEKELAESQRKLNSSGSSTEDPLDAFMTAVRRESSMDAVERRKLHLHVANLHRDAQRLRRLVELTRPTQMPSLLPSGIHINLEKPKKTLPLFGAMKGGSKFKLKTGTIGKLPSKRPNLPAELFNMKALSPSEEEEEGEEEEEKEEEEEEEVVAEKNEDKDDKEHAALTKTNVDNLESSAPMSQDSTSSGRKEKWGKCTLCVLPPVQLSGQYPEDDPDYCVWMPPAGQTGDGRTSLNDKYGY
uniref:FHA domain-containing protein n=1 Tax=Mola mola TaxID=94237 RepID=A0A3Q3VUA2_MOLML